jgi:pimeloyl-ACP methyl ester carboxylesterase
MVRRAALRPDRPASTGTRLRVACRVVATALVLAGCGDATTERSSFAPRFERAPCEFALPAGHDASDVLCGSVVVPADRAAGDGPRLRLAVAVLRATGPDPAPDPVVALSGGPGDPSLEGILRNWTRDFAAPLQEKRDLVFFDQRGTGRSSPALYCPEYAAAVRAALAEDLDAAGDAARANDGLLACHSRLRAAGVDLGAYTSAASAHDVRDVMHALGYERWNVRGISYGARLALTAVRDVPGEIRSVVLDSPVPPQASPIADAARHLQRSLDGLLAACASDPRCAAAYPDLRATLDALLARLDHEPSVIDAVDPESGAPLRVVVNGDRLLAGLRDALYSSDLLPLLPLVLQTTAQGDDTLLAAFAGEAVGPLSRLAWGMHHSVECFEEIPFVTGEVVAAATRGVTPRLLRFGLAAFVDASRAVCGFWDVRPAGALENEAVRSSIPTLILSGEHDPVTPPEYARLVARTMPNARTLVFRGHGHGVLGAHNPQDPDSSCARRVVAGFLDDPAAPLDASCVAAFQPPGFAGG